MIEISPRYTWSNRGLTRIQSAGWKVSKGVHKKQRKHAKMLLERVECPLTFLFPWAYDLVHDGNNPQKNVSCIFHGSFRLLKAL